MLTLISQHIFHQHISLENPPLPLKKLFPLLRFFWLKVKNPLVSPLRKTRGVLHGYGLMEVMVYRLHRVHPHCPRGKLWFQTSLSLLRGSIRERIRKVYQTENNELVDLTIVDFLACLSSGGSHPKLLSSLLSM